jgi:hypothetical protein
MGWVYAVAETNEQPAAPQGTTGATPPVLEDGEPLLKEALRLKIDGYRHGRS